MTMTKVITSLGKRCRAMVTTLVVAVPIVTVQWEAGKKATTLIRVLLYGHPPFRIQMVFRCPSYVV